MNLGKLSQFNLRDCWKEEKAFTQWLAGNLGLLGEAVNMKLELIQQEKPIGVFKVDILARRLDSHQNHFVLIKNQLDKADYNHLGRLLAYASGFSAKTILWVTQQIDSEYVKAIDWLNHNTPAGLDFFGIEMKLWQIGDSPLAPKFNVVSKPNTFNSFKSTEAQRTPAPAGVRAFAGAPDVAGVRAPSPTLAPSLKQSPVKPPAPAPHAPAVAESALVNKAVVQPQVKKPVAA